MCRLASLPVLSRFCYFGFPTTPDLLILEPEWHIDIMLTITALPIELFVYLVFVLLDLGMPVSCSYHVIMSSLLRPRPLQYSSLFLITRPPPLETSASQTSYLIFDVCETRSQTIQRFR